ncbi:ABC transporter ATP-binding protein [Gemmobacter nectariphilus]|uniref:ABC transporter ATP-binding protein n=1 Tax=Gemmobacter nectariphilus TaxID=220343 RepID=UPI000403065B|nr:ATP-binding cassette domain-containing protein [Gemmobacter nectariphilus]
MAAEVSAGTAKGGDTPLLALRGLRKTFGGGLPGARPALDGVDLSLAPGDFAVIIGSNGAGKSTLLNSIAGTFALDAGTIALSGRDITRLAGHRRAGMITRVFQDPMIGTAAAMTIEENLALAERRGQPRRLRLALDRRRRDSYRDRLRPLALGLEDRLTTPVALLSGGQRQALSLIMAVMSRPALLLLDEHTAALDPRTAEIVMEATLRVVAEQGLTALMVTHNMRQAIETGNRLVMMDAGRIRLDIAGPEKSALTAADLVEKFRIDNDRMLLGS